MGDLVVLEGTTGCDMCQCVSVSDGVRGERGQSRVQCRGLEGNSEMWGVVFCVTVTPSVEQL